MLNALKRHPGWLAGALLLLALLGWLIWHQWFKPEPPPTLITTTVTRGDIEDSVLATGALQAARLTNVGAQVGGRIKKLYVKVGDQVEEGQVIADIDDTTQRNALRAAQESVANYKAQKASRQSALALAQKEYKRQKYMYERQAASRADFESAEHALAAARADIDAVQAQIVQASMQMENAQADLGYTRVVAPSAGTVVSIVTQEGQTLNVMQSAPTIVKLADLDTMKIEAQISEADVARVKPGMDAYFTTLGDPDTRRPATLVSVEPGPINMKTYEGSNTDSAASTAVYYNGLLSVPNPEHELRIQMTAQVTLVLASARDVLMIPAGALGRKGKDGQYTVRVASGEKGKEKIERRPVEVGLNNRVHVEIKSGLQEGEQVIVGQGPAEGEERTTNMGRRRPRMF
ncbi:MAG: efflux RND transporter periplasmic adaptor subunit [Ottowia sp.]|nr:efflux RND transporter periplasmic adaptor subunit [Ottowia sp.]